MLSCGRARKNIKQRVEFIVTSVDNHCDNQVRSLKTDVHPVLPLGKQNSLVAFQSNCSTGVHMMNCALIVLPNEDG